MSILVGKDLRRSHTVILLEHNPKIRGGRKSTHLAYLSDCVAACLEQLHSIVHAHRLDKIDDRQSSLGFNFLEEKRRTHTHRTCKLLFTEILVRHILFHHFHSLRHKLLTAVLIRIFLLCASFFSGHLNLHLSTDSIISLRRFILRIIISGVKK